MTILQKAPVFRLCWQSPGVFLWGGGGTPIGGAMNQVAISALQEYTGKEFMYSDWLMHIIPYTVLATVVMYFGMRMLPMSGR